VENSVVQRLYELFRGDLRGMLKALEDGITALLGLTSAGAEVAPVGTAALQTQAQLVEVWQIKQPSVSQTLQQLIEAGAVEALPRRGREPIQYLMTGTARLAL
jgi:DNA-binding transcriptional ArsR family regulator